MAEDNNSFRSILPPEIEAQMPQNVPIGEQIRWRKEKIEELRVQQEKEAAVQMQTENSETADASADYDISADKNINQSNSQKFKTSHKQLKGYVKSTFENDDLTSVRNVPKNIFIELKRYFPKAERNSDLIAAVAYIFTNGACAISPEAMELVKSYKSDNAIFDLSEQIACLNRAVRSLDERTSAIELGISYEIFDRRFGSKERRKSPKENEFMEQGNLDMLYRLRVQAKDMRKLDDVERGRSIYEQVKGKNDSKNRQ